MWPGFLAERCNAGCPTQQQSINMVQLGQWQTTLNSCLNEIYTDIFNVMNIIDKNYNVKEEYNKEKLRMRSRMTWYVKIVKCCD